MIKLSKAETWRRCMSMWRHVYRKLKNGSGHNPGRIKHEWLKKYYPDDKPSFGCYFCAAAKRVAFKDNKCICIGCPAKEIDPLFDCDSGEDSWHSNGIGFYNKLRRAHRLYLKGLKDG